jgi:hypothetical protein
MLAVVDRLVRKAAQEVGQVADDRIWNAHGAMGKALPTIGTDLAPLGIYQDGPVQAVRDDHLKVTIVAGEQRYAIALVLGHATHPSFVSAERAVLRTAARSPSPGSARPVHCVVAGALTSRAKGFSNPGRKLSRPEFFVCAKILWPI